MRVGRPRIGEIRLLLDPTRPHICWLLIERHMLRRNHIFFNYILTYFLGLLFFLCVFNLKRFFFFHRVLILVVLERLREHLLHVFLPISFCILLMSFLYLLILYGGLKRLFQSYTAFLNLSFIIGLSFFCNMSRLIEIRCLLKISVLLFFLL